MTFSLYVRQNAKPGLDVRGLIRRGVTRFARFISDSFEMLAAVISIILALLPIVFACFLGAAL